MSCLELDFVLLTSFTTKDKVSPNFERGFPAKRFPVENTMKRYTFGSNRLQSVHETFVATNHRWCTISAARYDAGDIGRIEIPTVRKKY